MKRIVFTLLLTALAGCATSTRTTQGRGVVDGLQDTRQLEVWFLELQTDEESLTRLLSQTPVDCARACDLRASIANLSRKICSITRRMADDRERQVQCVDARRRSEIASANVKQVCECGT